MQINLVQPAELNVPKLDLPSRALLLAVLNTVAMGAGTVFVAVTYDKQTKCKPRKPSEDYMAMPGVSPKAQFGEVTQVFRTKAGRVRFRIRSASRGNGIDPNGWTTIIPTGLTAFVVTGLSPTPAPLQVQRSQGQGVSR